MRIRVDKTIIPYKLSRELSAAGVPLKHNVSLLPNNGLYIPLGAENAQYIDTVNAVIEAHDGIDDVAAKKRDAEGRVKNIPGWATWDEAQALDWYNEEIEPLNIPPAIKAFVRASIIMHLAARDELWPELNRDG